MSKPVRVMVERGKKKRVVASAFDWPGWDRSAKSEEEALAVLEAYRPRYAKVAAAAGHADDFKKLGKIEVFERLDGTGMTDFYGVSARAATPEHEQMSDFECERKLALLQACWKYFDRVATQVSPELRKGPRGGGRDRDRIIRHVTGAEITEFAKKLGVVTLVDSWDTATLKELGAYRKELCSAIRDYNGRGVMARTWTVQFVIRRSCYHLLDHAWEMEDKDLSGDN